METYFSEIRMKKYNNFHWIKSIWKCRLEYVGHLVGLNELTNSQEYQDSKVGPTWGTHGSCRSQMGHMLAPWTLLSGKFITYFDMALSWRQDRRRYPLAPWSGERFVHPSPGPCPGRESHTGQLVPWTQKASLKCNSVMNKRIQHWERYISVVKGIIKEDLVVDIVPVIGQAPLGSWAFQSQLKGLDHVSE